MVKSIAITVDPSATGAAIALDLKGNIYYANYWEHAVYGLDQDGALHMRYGSPGGGPGELHKPFQLLLHDQDQFLVVVGGDDRIQVFSTQSGAFVRSLPYLGVNGLMSNPAGGFLGIGMQDKFLIQEIDEQGQKGKEWMRGLGYSSAAASIRWSFAMSPRGTIYYAEGVTPELLHAQWRDEQVKVWTLSIPAHYVDPPGKPLPQEAYFDRKKVEAYYDSFSQIYDLFVLPESEVLLVVWKINEPVPYAVEAYDLKTRQRVLANFHPRGRPVCSRGELLACEEILEDEAGELLAHNLVLYRYQRQ